MKNSSKLFAEIERKRSCSRSGWPRFDASSRTRRLNCSQESSRLMNRCGLLRRSAAWGDPASRLLGWPRVSVGTGSGGRWRSADWRSTIDVTLLADCILWFPGRELADPPGSHSVEWHARLATPQGIHDSRTCWAHAHLHE